MLKLRGIISTLVTPFGRDHEIDVPALHRLVDFQLENKVHGIVVSGSVGEAPLLSLEERKNLFKATIDYVNGRVPVVCGVSAVGTDDAVRLARSAKDSGADALMAVSSFYYRLTDQEVYSYFKGIGDIGLPTIVYNNPSTSKIDISTDLMLKLAADSASIRYIKDSTGDLRRMHELIRNGRDKFVTLCGTDDLSMESFFLGAQGWISGAANIAPKECVEIWRLTVEQPDLSAALELYRKIVSVFALGETRNFVQHLKAGLKLRGLDMGPSRPPLSPLSPEETETVRMALKNGGIL